MIHFLVHEKADSVGVATVDITKGDIVVGKYMPTLEDITIEAASDIPLGHKIAIKEHFVNDSVIEYGFDIGKVVEKIKLGAHVHTHNLKTKRW
jgi:(2R)-sulfolactate sulfo-lyase subunit alpha